LSDVPAEADFFSASVSLGSRVASRESDIGWHPDRPPRRDLDGDATARREFNAIYHATSKRIRKLPVRMEQLLV
jgi:hypothetical protein